LQGGTGTDFTADGSLIRINLGSTPGSTTLASVKQGAAEVAVDNSGNVIAASTTGITQNNNAGRDVSQAVIALQNAAAKALSVRAWLDLH
jgi:flagellar capping protein FliD